MTEPNFITLKIDLTSTTITVSIINKQKQEEFIELIPGIKQYPLNIEFDNNEIIVCQQQPTQNTITNFVQDFFTNPTEYKRYSFIYQNKQYDVLAETLLVLIINEFKKIVDKKGIVNRFLFKCSNNDKEVLQRIKSSLVNIGIPNNFTKIKHEHEERKEFYIDEEFMIYEILEKQEEYQKFIFEMNRAKEIIKTTENKELQNKSYLFDEITDYNEYYSEEKYYQFKLQFTCKEREILKMHHLDDNYCIFLASKYFDTINDFKNIEMTCQRLNGTTDKYHYNPISITEEEYLNIVISFQTS